MSGFFRLCSAALILTLSAGQVSAGTGAGTLTAGAFRGSVAERAGFLRTLRKSPRVALPPKARANAQKKLETDIWSRFSHDSIESVSEVGRVLILTLVLTGAELVRMEVRDAGLEGRALDPERLEKLSLKAAQTLINDGRFWLSIVSAGIVGKITEKPVLILRSLIENPVSNRFLVDLIHSGILSFITFTGWEAGAELWDEATLLLPSDTDYNKAQDVLSLLAGATHRPEDRQVLASILDNMGRILLTDDELRGEWLYNTWRLHLATGQFVTIVSSMVGAGAIGTALFPGAGTVAGMMFGAAGGLIAMAVPEEFKEAMSNEFRSFRRDADLSALLENREKITSLLAKNETLQEEFAQRSKLREAVMTTYFEEDYALQVLIKSLKHETETARQTLAKRDLTRDEADDLERVISDHEERLEELQPKVRGLENEMLAFYLKEVRALNRLKTDHSSPELARELKKAETLRDFFKKFRKTDTDGTLFGKKKALWIQTARLRDFKEKRALRN